jgi:hypothetical protein
VFPRWCGITHDSKIHQTTARVCSLVHPANYETLLLLTAFCSVRFSQWWSMISLQQRIATVIHSTTKLLAHLRELDRLRERVRKAN